MQKIEVATLEVHTSYKKIAEPNYSPDFVVTEINLLFAKQSNKILLIL